MATLETWNGRTSGQTDADSPLDTTLMDGMRKDLDHLRQTVYGNSEAGGTYFTPEWGHTHNGSDSKLITTFSPSTTSMGTVVLGCLNLNSVSDNYLGYVYSGGTLSGFVVHSPVTIKDLFVSCNASPGSGKSFTFTLMKNGVATALTCQVADTATAANDTVHSVNFAAGDVAELKCTPAGSPVGTIDACASFRTLKLGKTIAEHVIPHFDGTLLCGIVGGKFALANASYIDRAIGINDSGAAASLSIPYLCTFPATMNSVLKFNNIGAYLAAEETVTIAETGSIRGSIGLGCEDIMLGLATSGVIIFNATLCPQNATRYLGTNGASAPASTESEVQIPVKAGVIKNLCILNHSTGVAAQTWTATLRKNGVDTALTATLTGTDIVQSDTSNSITFADGDKASIKLVSSATTGTRDITVTVEHLSS